MRRFGPRIAKIKCSVARRVDQDADAFSRYIERYGRVRISGIEPWIGIDAHNFLLAALCERKHLQPHPKDLLVRPQRQLHHAPAGGLFAANVRRSRASASGSLANASTCAGTSRLETGVKRSGVPMVALHTPG